MSTTQSEAIRQVLEQYVSVWNTGAVDRLDEVLHPEFTFQAGPLADVRGLAAFKLWLLEFRKSVPDYFLEIEDTIVEGEKYATKWTWRGHHTGESAIQLVPPTGAALAVAGGSFGYLEEGRLYHEFAFPDNLGFLTQLGVIPALEAAGEA
jgi:steroid delta-isomerase-like uncharacterized protein